MSSTPDSRNRWALLIGINEYPLLKPRGQLTGCINDVEVMSQTLRQQFGFPEDHVTILRDSEATREGILAAMDGLVERVGKDDVVVFHYSGHGSRVRRREGGGEDDFHETLFPHDSGRGDHPNRDILDDEIYAWLLRLTALTPYITLIFDCCHSGTIVRDVFGEISRSVEQDDRPAGEVASSSLLAQTRSLGGNAREVGPSGWLPLGERYILIAGCSHAESSYEVGVGEPQVRHGALTYFLTQELVKVGSGTTCRDVFEKVAPLVTSYYPSQHPQLEGARDREIFGIRTIEPMAFVPVLERKGSQVTLGAGASCGLTVGSHWHVHPPGTKKVEGEPLGKVTISRVGAVTSEATIVEEVRPGSIRAGARAVESSHFLGVTRLAVEVMVPRGRAEVEKLLELLGESRLLRRVGEGEAAEVRIYLLPPRLGGRAGDPVSSLGALREETWAVVGPHGHLLMLPRSYGDLEAVEAIVQNLENRVRYRQTCELANDRSTLAGKVGLKVLRHLENGSWGEPEMDVDGETVLFDGDEILLEITNWDTRPLYMYILNLGVGGSVSQLYPVQGAQQAFAPAYDSAHDPSLPPGRTFRYGIRSGEELEMSMPEELLSSWRLFGLSSPEGREMMKLFATTQPADFKVLLHPGYLRGKEGDALAKLVGDSLTSLLVDIVEGGEREVKRRSPEDDWTTVQRSFRLKPRKVGIPMPLGETAAG